MLETQEEPKAHDELPDGIGMGYPEERDTTGQIIISLTGYARIVVGKFKHPRTNGNEYYVTFKPDGMLRNGEVSTHDHLLTAAARIAEIIEEHENANLQD